MNHQLHDNPYVQNHLRSALGGDHGEIGGLTPGIQPPIPPIIKTSPTDLEPDLMSEPTYAHAPSAVDGWIHPLTDGFGNGGS